MCKKPIQKDVLDSCLGEEGADSRFGTYLTHSKQDTGYNASLVFSLWKGARRLGFISFSVLYYRVTKSFLILILKIRIKDTMNSYFWYCHMLL